MRPTGWLKQTLLLMLATTPLLGCEKEAPDAAVPPPPPIVIVKCGTVSELTPLQQKEASLELYALPESSVIGNKIMPDWMRMRDEIRACRKTNSPPPAS